MVLQVLSLSASLVEHVFSCPLALTSLSMCYVPGTYITP